MMGYEIDGELQLKQADKSELLLAQMDQWLQALKSLASDDKERKQAHAKWLAKYWDLRAQQAQLRERPFDAMAFYERALLTRLDAQLKPAAESKDELADKARVLFMSLGGTEDGWQLWYKRPANDLASEVTLQWGKDESTFPCV